MGRRASFLNGVLMFFCLSICFFTEVEAYEKKTALKEEDWRHPLVSQPQGGPLGYPRNYANQVTPEEKNDIRFIVLCLANKSVVSIALAKDDLEMAGDRIDHLHPLRFLEAIFGDPELLPAAKKIRNKRWVWNQFTGGVKQSLATEAELLNLYDFIDDFTKRLDIVDHRAAIQALLNAKRWDDFIEVLLRHVQRKGGDFDRYDF